MKIQFKQKKGALMCKYNRTSFADELQGGGQARFSEPRARRRQTRAQCVRFRLSAVPFVVTQVVAITPLPSISARFATSSVCIRQSYPTVAIYPTTATKDNVNCLQLVQ